MFACLENIALFWLIDWLIDWLICDEPLQIRNWKKYLKLRLSVKLKEYSDQWSVLYKYTVKGNKKLYKIYFKKLYFFKGS